MHCLNSGPFILNALHLVENCRLGTWRGTNPADVVGENRVWWLRIIIGYVDVWLLCLSWFWCKNQVENFCIEYYFFVEIYWKASSSDLVGGKYASGSRSSCYSYIVMKIILDNFSWSIVCAPFLPEQHGKNWNNKKTFAFGTPSSIRYKTCFFITTFFN